MLTEYMEYMEEIEKSTAGVKENAVRNKFNKYMESMQAVDDIVSDLNKALHRINNVQSEFYYVTQITSDSEPDEVEFKIMLDDDVLFEFDADDVGQGVNMNKVILSGELVRDAVVRTTKTGKVLSSFTIKADSTYEANGETLTFYTYVNCVYWERLQLPLQAMRFR